MHSKIRLFPSLEKSVSELELRQVHPERIALLGVLIKYINNKIQAGGPVHLNFICTHNSRRSQFAQIWAQTAAGYYGVDARCYSGGVEVTTFNPRAVNTLQRQGFEIESDNGSNPHYTVKFSTDAAPVMAFSKLFDDPVNAVASFAAVMTCSHADENCPFIPGTEQRIPLLYDDPKAFDDTPLEAEKYLERSQQIATEMFYVFAQVSKSES